MDAKFLEDCLGRLVTQVKAGTLPRRDFLRIAGLVAAGAPLALRMPTAEAAGSEMVFVNWGGDASKAYDTAFGVPFANATGITVKQDGTGPTEGALIAQFKSGKPTWDVVDADPYSAITLGKQGMLEPIDYAVVDKTKVRPGFVWDYEVATYFYSYVIAYDSTKFGDKAPTSMADFFDVKKFPGKRSLYKWGAGMWEAALLADGVAPDKLYPLDLDRAHAKIKAFKDNIVSFWGGGAESQNVLLSGEASMALVWSTRAGLIEKDSDGSVKYIWDQGILTPGGMAVIKNNPVGKDAAMKFIASAQDPKQQLVMFDMLGQGPANPAADALIPADKRRLNCADPANAAKQIAMDMGWYAAHYSEALDAYTRLISA
ncbi:MAG: ABC transporter substrate-binding protein [Azospirillaceae bacterium]|nr:ABC transporter substrate-binding protein [Azospirillaceae bacterium]